MEGYREHRREQAARSMAWSRVRKQVLGIPDRPHIAQRQRGPGRDASPKTYYRWMMTEAAWRGAPLTPGQFFGRWYVDALIGQGGMASVYRAHNPATDEEAALKIINAREEPEEVRRRFRREGRLGRRLCDPRIARVMDSGRIGIYEYIASEYIAGPPLAILLEPELPMPVVVRIAEDVAGALAHAHERGVVHRDVSPNNVLIRPDGAPRDRPALRLGRREARRWRAVLVDFGLARLTSASGVTTTLTSDHTVMGTPGFISPEVEAGRVHEAGPEADVFSWGEVLEAMLGDRRLRGDRVPEPIHDVMFEALWDDPRTRPANGGVLLKRFRRAVREACR